MLRPKTIITNWILYIFIGFFFALLAISSNNILVLTFVYGTLLFLADYSRYFFEMEENL